MKFIDYPESEKLCEQLADQLVEEVGRPALETAHFVGIPRGGFVVLGLLSYFLDLRPEQLIGSAEAPPTLVLVDDVAFSGMRLRRYLPTDRSVDVAFATLASPEPLRRGIVEQSQVGGVCLRSRYRMYGIGPERLPRVAAAFGEGALS